MVGVDSHGPDLCVAGVGRNSHALDWLPDLQTELLPERHEEWLPDHVHVARKNQDVIALCVRSPASSLEVFVDAGAQIERGEAKLVRVGESEPNQRIGQREGLNGC